MFIEKIKAHHSFSGQTVFAKHKSLQTGTEMKFSYHIPGKKKVTKAILWLSGLTCTEENFIAKSGVQAQLADTEIMVICPDTSPRGLHLPGEHESYDFGSGAGFYVDATTEHYRDHYKMYSYLIEEFVPLVKEHFSLDALAISGHSMGGHGALVLGLRNPDLFSSISAFSPIVHPSIVPWGEKAFTGYLGTDRKTWAPYDACDLLAAGNKHPQTILIEQGLGDEFLAVQLQTEELVKVCKEQGQPLKVNYREGYDHSYYFIATFLAEHLKHWQGSFL